jgi:hypothetical protein
MTAGDGSACPRGRARPALAAGALLLGLASGGGAEEAPSPDALARGRQIYREGMLGPGRPLTGRVQGDAVVTAGQAACANCHQRSGLGGVEGSVVVPPITGPALAQATTGSRKRPAYSDATLARAIRDGLDAAGHPLHPLMPRYALADAEVAAVGAYLRTLSAGQSPGVSDRAVHFATVVTEDVPPARQQAMLDVLEACVGEVDQQVRVPGARSYGPSRLGRVAARAWVLHRWILKGSPDTWPTQLDAHYRSQPVFAVLSGISARDWRPVHDFCERHEIPCLLPNTPLPAVRADDFYTLYLSKGLALEAQVLAAHMARTSPRPRILQVFPRDAAGETAAEVLRSALVGRVAVVDWPLAKRESPSPEALAARLVATRSTAAVLWLPPEGWARLGGGWRPVEPVTVYGSSTLLEGDLGAVPESLRDGSLVIHSLAPQRRIRRVEGWLAGHGLVPAQAPVQAQTYLACLVAGEGLKRAGERLNRDRFLEVIDRLAMAPMGSGFPRPDFAPGRRYLVNGAYLLEIGTGPNLAIRSARWIVP